MGKFRQWAQISLEHPPTRAVEFPCNSSLADAVLYRMELLKLRGSEDDCHPAPLGEDERSTLVTASVEPLRDSLDHLLGSEAFVNAPRLREVLKFMIDSLLNGTAESINEQAIGQAVFGRPPGYNPAEDNIVRVTIRHLRERIGEYYRSEGRHEEFVFGIPKGKYVPTIVCRPAVDSIDVAEQGKAPVASDGVAQETQPNVLEQAAESSRFPFRVKLSWILVGILAFSNALACLLLYRNAINSPTSKPIGLLRLLLLPSNSVTIVVTDANLQAYREIFQKQVSLSNYIDRTYAQRPPNPSNAFSEGVSRFVTGADETSLASSLIVAEIEVAATPITVSVKHPHDLSMRDLQHGSYILLGGPWINPWGQLFEDRLNFRVLPRKDDPATSEIDNLKPNSNEPSFFIPHQEGNLVVNYVRIALLRNLSNSGFVVLLGATSEDALEAGGRFLASQDSLQDLLRTFKVDSPQKLPSLEVVFEVQGLQAIPDHLRIVAVRAVTPQF